MTALVITDTDVHLVRSGAGEHQHTAPALEAISAGQYIRPDPSTGKFRLGNATTSTEVGEGYIALATVAAGESVTGVQSPCVVNVGAALAALDYGAKVYVSDTDGSLDTAAGTVTKIAGTVVPAFAQASGTAEKLLKLTGLGVN